MSELDSYLLVALSCTICGFFIGMGQTIMTIEDGHFDTPLTPEIKMVFSLAGLVGTGYFIAWLWVSHQPMFKLIPVLVLAYLAAILGGGLTKAKITTWFPAMGLVIVPIMFHVARYWELA
ncbi:MULTISPECIES: hypothetical protein [unclassified Halomonas]|uniref:hypothetical protein n=1 Tax=unclassified Halomonas TaxID=2609666 RepID=UPI001EF6739D|nr:MULTISPECIES: hypothetical protein [unclassified Halomonas]MCG7592341.1 hypothetical protein [Halomonas sp. McD50-5]MCG7618393.1 hypothetical protein [Halomonas sp. McD50-4]